MTTSLDLAHYSSALRAGAVLACPTETQMGLLADACNQVAVARVCEMKRRPAHEPIALLIPALTSLNDLGLELTDAAATLAARHWPGPLTLVLRTSPGCQLPAALLRDGTVGVRVPGPSPALDLVRAFGGALTATSANLSGQPPLSDPAALRATFGAALFDVVPGDVPGGAPSTIVDASAPQLRVLRRGAIELAPADLHC